jgi:hypothetical protein
VALKKGAPSCVAALLLGCGSGAAQTASPPVTNAASVTNAATWSREPVRCTAIPHECPSSKDVDGCPEPIIVFSSGCSPQPETAHDIADIADEMKQDPNITRLDLYGSPECTDHVRSELIRRGVGPERVLAKVPHTTEVDAVRPEIGAYAGKECP